MHAAMVEAYPLGRKHVGPAAGTIAAVPSGRECFEAPMAPMDLFPTLCGLCRIAPPRTISGRNLADV